MLTFEYSTANRDMPVAYGSFRAMHTLCEVLIAGIARPAAEELIRRIYERAGVLDRFDSVIFCAPLIELLVRILPTLG